MIGSVPYSHKDCMKYFLTFLIIGLMTLGTLASQAIADGQVLHDKQGVHIKFDSIELQQAAQKITDKTGIIFTLGDGIRSRNVTVDIRASDWKTAIAELLTDFNRVEVWTDDLVNSRIWVLQENSGGPPIIISKPRSTRKPTVATQNRTPSWSRNRKTDPPEVVTNKTISTLPPHILMDPGVLKYLQSVGISLPENMRRNYENMLKDLEEIEIPISPTVWKTPQFQTYLRYLESIGIPLPPEQG